MADLMNNLFPPIVSTYQPAFILGINSSCRINFSLSNYNSYADASNAQVIIRDISSNKIIKDIKTTVNEEVNSTRDDRYYIDIPSNGMEVNKYYSAQIRFIKNASFSEWSTMTILKGISRPSLNIKGLEKNSTNQSVAEILDIVGKLTFEDLEEKEILESYEITLLNKNEELLYDSGILYPSLNAPNELNYTIKYRLRESENYIVKIYYITTNGYSNIESYDIYSISDYTENIELNLMVSPDTENGKMILAVSGPHFLGNFSIRRASEKTNYTIYEDIYTKSIISSDYPKGANQIFFQTYYDYTIESGVKYKYAIQKRSSYGNRGLLKPMDGLPTVEAIFDDIFLTNAKMQFKVKYNPGISSFKRNILESKTDSIGSKYAFVRRNANVDYKSFPITGLISMHAEEDKIDFNKEEYFKEQTSLLGHTSDTYNDITHKLIKKSLEHLKLDLATAANSLDKSEIEAQIKELENETKQKYNPRINAYNDFIAERDFRNAIIDFLYDNNVKLFRSTTEGNILVKLMNINFTPNQQIGRMLYTFSADAVEMDDCTVDNYDKYNIQLIGTYNQNLSSEHIRFSQLNTKVEPNQDIITDILQNKIKAEQQVQGFTNDIQGLKWLRIEIDTDKEKPYLIDISDGKPKKINNVAEGSKSNIVVGYIAEINNNPIVIAPHGRYELNENDIVINSLKFATPQTVSIDYIAKVKESELKEKIAKIITYYTKVGQLYGTFDYNSNILTSIFSKYNVKYSDYYDLVIDVTYISIETDPGMIIAIKDETDSKIEKHIVGSTGILRLEDEVGKLRLNNSCSIAFIGKKLNLSNNPNHLDEYEYYLANEDKPILEKAKNNYVYNNGQIFYNGKFYNFDSKLEAIVDDSYKSEATIDYIYELKRGRY